MLTRILSLLGAQKFLKPEAIRSGLQKINPKFKKFFDDTSKYGYPIGAALGFLQSELSGSEQQVDPNLRPDEAANVELKRQQDFGPRVASTIAKTAGGAALGGLGGAALSGLGSILQPDQQEAGAPSMGQEPQPQPQLPATPSANFIAKHPELGAYLDNLIAKGTQPREAALDAKGKRKFKPSVEQIESDMGQLFEDLISGLFQQQKPQGRPQPSAQSQGGMTPAMSQFMGALQEYKKLKGL